MIVINYFETINSSSNNIIETEIDDDTSFLYHSATENMNNVSTKFWYHPKTDKIIKVPNLNIHTETAFYDMGYDIYGDINYDFQKHERLVFLLAMKDGWVRGGYSKRYSASTKEPSLFLNGEQNDVRNSARKFYNKGVLFETLYFDILVKNEKNRIEKFYSGELCDNRLIQFLKRGVILSESSNERTIPQQFWYHPKTKEMIYVPLLHTYTAYKEMGYIPHRDKESSESSKDKALKDGWVRGRYDKWSKDAIQISLEGEKEAVHKTFVFLHKTGIYYTRLIIDIFNLNDNNEITSKKSYTFSDNKLKQYLNNNRLSEKSNSTKEHNLNEISPNLRWTNTNTVYVKDNKCQVLVETLNSKKFQFWYHPKTKEMIDVEYIHALTASKKMGYEPLSEKNRKSPLKAALGDGWVRGKYAETTDSYDINLEGEKKSVHKTAIDLYKKGIYINKLIIDIFNIDNNKEIVFSSRASHILTDHKLKWYLKRSSFI